MITYVSPGIALLAAVAANAVAFISVPAVIRMAGRLGAMDLPGPRKVHDIPTARLGGVAVALGCLAAWLVILLSGDQVSPELRLIAPGFILGSLLVLGIGMLDDIYQLSAPPKLLIQLGAATVAWYFGIAFSEITVPWTGESAALGWLGLPATLFWIVLVTNAWNLIDGLDGLAASLGFIACTIFAILLVMRRQDAALVFIIPLLGALLGFLPNNLRPARIFLGDSGSYLIGYQLALLSIITGQKGITSFAVFAPLAILGLPILDTLFAVIRRLVRSEKLSWKERLTGVFQADRSHLHHQALDRGWTANRTLVLLSGLSGLLGLFGLTVTFAREPRLGGLLLLAAVFVLYHLYSQPRLESEADFEARQRKLDLEDDE